MEQKARLFVRAERVVRIAAKRREHGAFFKADRDEMLFGNKNTERQRVIAVFRFPHDRRIDDDENVIVFQLYVGTFFRVQCRTEIFNRNRRNLGQTDQFFFCRIHDVKPGAFFRRFRHDLPQDLIFVMFVRDEHRSTSFHFRLVMNALRAKISPHRHAYYTIRRRKTKVPRRKKTCKVKINTL